MRSDYKTLISGLRVFYNSLRDKSQNQQQMDEFFDGRYDFEQAFADFRNLGADNNLSRLMAEIKELSDQKILNFKRYEDSAVNTKETILKEMHELEKINDQV